jgi:hypothetical protein
VLIHYNKRAAAGMPYHGCLARVVVVCRGRPRNHGVKLVDRQLLPIGDLIGVPAGNLRPAGDADFRRPPLG